MRCIYCNSNNCPKKGKNGVIQKYYCHTCKKYFQENSRENMNLKLIILEEYVFHKQTYSELNELFSVKKKVVQKIIDSYVVPIKIHHPRPIVLVVDATYFGKRNNGGIWGVLVFKDNITKEILWYKFLEDRETSTDYLEGKKELLRLGYIIIAVVGDGFSGIYEVFKEYPVQFCHFHIKQLVKRYVSFNTKNPIMLLLKDIIDRLSYCEEKDFKIWITEFMFEHESFIQEKRRSALTGRPYFVRKELVSLLRSLIKNISYIFTYRNSPLLHIPNTTNCLEGFFTHLKIKLRVHRGLSKKRQKKIIEIMLLNSSTVKKR